MTSAVVAEYGYDGLNRRITRTIGSDSPIHEYYTESWQRIESRPGGESSTQGVSLFVFGIRYIDDIVMRQRDANASGPPEERRYYLTDANYNVSMIVTDSGWGVERIFYTAYGEPEVFPFGDADGDYDVDAADETLITSIKNSTDPYNILADLNLDGAVTQADLNAFSAYSGALGGRNVLTASDGSATTGNDIGYAGYTWNDERSQWHVRHREYDPKLGRWLQRDPLGNFAGVNNVLYASAHPLGNVDPLGLEDVPYRHLFDPHGLGEEWQRFFHHNKQKDFKFLRGRSMDLTDEDQFDAIRQWLAEFTDDMKSKGRLPADFTLPPGVTLAAFVFILTYFTPDVIGALEAFPESAACRAFFEAMWKFDCVGMVNSYKECALDLGLATGQGVTKESFEIIANEAIAGCGELKAKLCPEPDPAEPRGPTDTEPTNPAPGNPTPKPTQSSQPLPPGAIPWGGINPPPYMTWEQLYGPRFVRQWGKDRYIRPDMRN